MGVGKKWFLQSICREDNDNCKLTQNGKCFVPLALTWNSWTATLILKTPTGPDVNLFMGNKLLYKCENKEINKLLILCEESKILALRREHE